MSNDNGVEKKAIGLALSGGGVRAASFHAGVLRYVAEQGLLENVTHISSVSGGTLLIGMTFKFAEYQWPNSRAYLDDVFPRLRHILTTRSLQKSVLSRVPLHLLYRLNALTKSIETLWGVNALLSDLGTFPAWSINCTTAETGRRFRFMNNSMGDHELGYAAVPDFSLAKAMAVSAAVPVLVGPLTIKTENFEWKRLGKPYRPPYEYLNLYDGGLYDNLGMEPMFDVEKQKLKKAAGVTYLLVSHGGAILPRENSFKLLNPSRVMRFFNILLDQNQALRVRIFLNFQRQAPASCAFVKIGSKAEDRIRYHSPGREVYAEKLLGENWLSPEEVKTAADYATDLSRMPENMFDLIAQHGYETTKWNMEMMSRPATASLKKQRDG